MRLVCWGVRMGERLVSADAKLAWESLYHDTPWYAAHAPLLVKDKVTTQSVPMAFNFAQRYIWARAWTMARQGRLVRLVVPKARQLGVTTMGLGHNIHVANTRQAREMYVLMHDLKPALTAWRRMKQMHLGIGTVATELGGKEFHLPRAAITNESRGRLLEFETESSILVESVKKMGVGRGETLHHVKATELPSWDNPEETMDGIEESVPELPNFESSIILESTSLGVGDWWYWLCQKAAAGDSPYELVFLPWWLELAYGLSDPKPWDLRRAWVPGGDVRLADCLKEPLTAEEELLGKTILREAPGFGITFLSPDMVVQKLLWRRRKIQQRGYSKFMQEYPANLAESFQGTGKPVFRAESVFFHKNRLDPVSEDRLIVPAPQRLEVFHKDTIIDGVKPKQLWDIREDGQGPLHVWKGYEQGERYIIGGDPASGEGSDPSAIQVLKVRPDRLEQVAVWHGWTGQVQLAYITAWLMRAYDNALAVPEVTGLGALYVETLMGLRWPGRRVYQRKVLSGTGERMIDRPGFDMNQSTRAAVIETIYELLTTEQPIFRHEQTLIEMEQFRLDKNGKPDHPSGGHSDLLMAWGIAAYARNQHSTVRNRPKRARGVSYETSNKPKGVGMRLHTGA